MSEVVVTITAKDNTAQGFQSAIAGAKKLETAMKGLGSAQANASALMDGWSKSQYAAAQAGASLANKAQVLGDKVAKGNMSIAQATREYKAYEQQMKRNVWQTMTFGEKMDVIRPKINAAAMSIAKFGASAVAIGVAGKQIYEFGKSGAQVELTRIKFDRLAKSVGTTGDVFLNDLRRATRGTVSDFSALKLGSDVLQLGLAKNAKEATRLAGVMTALGMDTGEVTLALANQSTRRLDQLGLSLTRFKQIQKEVAKEMPNLSKEDLFTEAFLRTGEATIATTGNLADSRYGNYMRFEASVENIKNEAKLGMADMLASTMEGVSQFMTGIANLSSGRTVLDMSGGLGADRWVRELPTWASNESVSQRMASMGFNQSGFGLGAQQAQQTARSQLVNEARNRWYQTRAAQESGAGAAAGQIPENYAAMLPGALKLTEFTKQRADAIREANAALVEEQQELLKIQGMYGENSKRAKEQAEVVKQVEMEVSQVRIQAAEEQRNMQNDVMMGLIATAAGEEDAAQKQMEFALATGQISEEVYKQQQAMMGFADVFANTSQSADEAAKMAERFYQYLSMLDGMSVDAYINFITTGNLPATGAGGGQLVGGGTGSAGVPRPNIAMEASGGSFSGWALTGDSHAGPTAYSELVYAPHGAYVYNAQQTRAMLPSMSGVNRYASGGAIMLDGETTLNPLHFVTYGGASFNKPKTSATDVSGVDVSTAVMQPVITGVQQAVTQTQVGMTMAVTQMTAETRRTNDLLKELVAKTATELGIGRAVNADRSRFS